MLILDDALSALDMFLPNASVDCVIADPPYGSTQNKWDSIIPLEQLWPELFRVCKGPIVLTAIQPFSSLLVSSQLKTFKHEWIWEKNKGSGHLNCKKAPMRYHESVLVFCAGQMTYNPQMTTDHKPGNFAVRRTGTSNYGAQKEATYGGQTERYPRSIQKFNVVNNDSLERFHPTQKPEDLMAFLIRTYSNIGETVLDFCMGSGTTGVAAKKEGREFIGIESNDEYFDFAKKRIDAT